VKGGNEGSGGRRKDRGRGHGKGGEEKREWGERLGGVQMGEGNG